MTDTAIRKSSRGKSSNEETQAAVTNRAPSSIELYRADFQRQPDAPDWLQTLRKQGITRFEGLGFPTTKNEDWHFTSVAPIADRAFSLASASAELHHS